jgi:predicted AAA+ superfamily ATPase
MTIETELLQEIRDFVRKTGMAETTFGRLAANDGKLVARLRAGSGVTTRTVEKIRSYLRAHNGSPAKIRPDARAGERDPAAQALERIADALSRLAPAPVADVDLDAGDAFVWQAEDLRLVPIEAVNRVEIRLLKGIDRQMDLLLDNTRRFAHGLPANNALLWGARGTGKSSLVKAVHAKVLEDRPGSLALVEIHREDIPSLPKLLALLRASDRRCLLFCDDLSFEGSDASFKSLKAVLEGGIEGRPPNVVFYATSNRRHLMPRDMIDNERSTAINPAEAVEEKVSLSDRFGLWLGFHNCDQPTYLAIVEGYAKRYGLDSPRLDLAAEASEWAVTRGARSGRVAWQFIQDLAGRLGKTLD